MNWYKHDTNAATDAKIRKLIIKYGAEGYAIYFHCLELIAADINENNITFELEHDAEIIADNLKIKSTPECAAIDKVNEIMEYIVKLNLFQDNGGRIFCFKMLKRLDSSMTSSPKFREFIRKAKENHDEIMINPDSVMQEEIRREEKRTEEKRQILPKDKKEVFDYLILKGIHKEVAKNTAIKFYDGYNENNWKDSKGNKIYSWKQKVIHVWLDRALEESKKYKDIKILA